MKVEKYCKKTYIFSSKNGFLLIPIILLNLNGIYADRSELDISDEISELKISISVELYDVKTAKNYRNFYGAERRIVIKDIDPKLL